jgi:hypothetical protein
MSTLDPFPRAGAPVLPGRATEDTQQLGPPPAGTGDVTQPLEPPAFPPGDTQPPDPPPPAGPPGEIPASPGHRRRRWLWPAVAGAAVLAVLVPLAVYAIVEGGEEGGSHSALAPVEPAATEPAPTQPAPTEPAEGPSVPDGRIPIGELWNATLDIPAWPEDALAIGPSGHLTFTDGECPEPPNSGVGIWLSLPEDVAYGDVDGDGAQETVVNVWSHLGQGGSWQVLALDRDQEGAIITLGLVTVTTGPIKTIDDHIQVVDGAIQVSVGDYLACCGDDATINQWQTRTYAWQSGRFAQVAGPSEFHNPRITDLSVSAEDLVLAAPVGGVRHGTLRLSVTVDEPVVPHHLSPHFWYPAGLEREGATWTGTPVDTGEGGVEVLVEVDPPGSVGATRTYTFGFSAAADADLGDDPTVWVYVNGQTADDESFGEYEPSRDDNSVSVPITVE